ncbi:MAG TPA: aldehyde dehydrogenase family protein [Polyangiaceae bacterium]|nr:aldehyde dehydrogenase family protein [Polyangiaceae bacterium]
MTNRFSCISPSDGRVFAEREFTPPAAVRNTLEAAQAGARAWRHVPLSERQALIAKAVDRFVANQDTLAREITLQMGRPVSQSPGEIRGFEDRARTMIALATAALADVVPAPKEGFTRFIRKEPLGVVLAIAPWNYPFLTAVNTVVPALLSGNAVILRHSPQTPLCAERMVEAFSAAGVPAGVFQFLHTTDEDTDELIRTPGVDHVAFTGSVRVGHVVQRFASERFISLGLELGGKDPAYVRADANFDHAVENLVDGAMFNSGQSCCAIERIYVHESLYDRFVDAFVALTKQYKLGNPADKETNLGPLVRTSAADFVRGQIRDAVAAGARALVDESAFSMSKAGTPYLAPQVLVNVDHSMRVMTEESFGPVVGIMKVKTDDEAVRLMNDSPFGLTAAIWTSDEAAALRLGNAIDTGTVFMNRCDYLDPALAWVGLKDSGRGVTLSSLGFEVLTRPKSYHLRRV